MNEMVQYNIQSFPAELVTLRVLERIDPVFENSRDVFNQGADTR